MNKCPTARRPVCLPTAPAHAGVPMTLWLAVTLSSGPDFARPKSRTLTPDLAIIMLPGLRSR